jgi:hypothetical protein
MTRMNNWEMEVADAAHFMGYELLRAQDGYVLARQHGAECKIITAPTLCEITEYLKH